MTDAPHTPTEWVALAVGIAAVLILGVLPVVSMFRRDATTGQHGPTR